jgi:probable biosynthetic protein (TIGR04098 family)
MSQIVVDLPQTDAAGLSESWLFKHCGNLHWRELCTALGISRVNSSELSGEDGKPLYPTFVAIRARFDQPLSAIRLGDRFSTTISLTHFGRTFFCSRIELAGDGINCQLEMLTAFASLDARGANELHHTSPQLGLRSGATPLLRPPEILTQCKAVRRGALANYELVGHEFALQESPLTLTARCEPSPYTDFNGVGLLYFASYPSITDTLERRLIHDHGLFRDERDWALSSSTIARDVFYHGNLALGESIVANLQRFDRVGNDAFLHTILVAHKGGRKLADVLTAKRLHSCGNPNGKSECCNIGEETPARVN